MGRGRGLTHEYCDCRMGSDPANGRAHDRALTLSESVTETVRASAVPIKRGSGGVTVSQCGHCAFALGTIQKAFVLFELRIHSQCFAVAPAEWQETL